MNRLRRLLAPSTLACVLLVALAFAASASAEVRTGEASSPVNLAVTGEEDLLHASAGYDSRTGSLVVEATTREAPGPEPKVGVITGLATVKGACDKSLFGTSEPAYPQLLVLSFDEGEGEPNTPREWRTSWLTFEGEGAPGDSGPGSWSQEGTTATVAATAAAAVGRPYNCAFVSIGTLNGGPEENGESVLFPIAVPTPPEPPKPVEITKTVTVTKDAPAPPPAAPGNLQIARSKALSPKPGKWARTSFKVTNTGGTAIGPIAIGAKAPAGVQAQPLQSKVPALLPGQSWSVGLRVRLTAAAKASSTIALTADGAGLTAKGSVTVKSAG
jgi:hypothetical protein